MSEDDAAQRPEPEARDPRRLGQLVPLDPFDPRFHEPVRPPRPVAPADRVRRLVPARGPGVAASPDDARVRILRVAIPAIALAGLAAVALVFFVAMDPGSGVHVVGPEATVRGAVRDRPHRVCLRDAQPCAWLTLVDGELVAFNTNGPLPAEYGRLGVAWCPSSRWFGANATGSRFDQRGTVVRGPAPRGLDRFTLLRVGSDVAVDFSGLTAGQPAGTAREMLPPAGQDCGQIPFDRNADLEL